MSNKKQAFECQMCGQCCLGEGGIIVSSQERERIAIFLNLTPDQFTKRFTEKKGEKFRLQVNEQSYCVFFSQKGCSIHEVKPDVCRAWPFFRGNLVDKTSWELAQDYCPGINTEVEHEEFVRQGKNYLQQHGLLKDKNSVGANALKI